MTTGQDEHLNGLQGECMGLDGQRLIQATGCQNLDTIVLGVDQALGLQIVQRNDVVCAEIFGSSRLSPNRCPGGQADEPDRNGY